MAKGLAKASGVRLAKGDWPRGEPDGTDALPAAGAQGLPPGDYWPSAASFEQTFVKVEGSTRRKKIYKNWSRHRQALIQLGCPATSESLINGSYTTSKLDPEDIDLVVFVKVVDPSDTNEFAQLERIAELLQGPGTKDEYDCDAYMVPMLPEDHADYDDVTGKWIEYWTTWFGKDRAGNPKGRVWTLVGGLR